MAAIMYKMFFDGSIHLPLSNREANIIEISFGICIAVECWSILENMKRLGFNLLGSITKAFKGFYGALKAVKGENID